MVCGEPNRSAHFYEAALGFVQTGEASKAEPAFAKLIGIPDALARVITLQLGEQEIELVGSLLSLYLLRASSAVWVIEFPWCFA